MNIAPRQVAKFAISATVSAIASFTIGLSEAVAGLILGNTDTHNVVLFDERSGRYGGEFIPAIDGFFSPDDLTFGPDGNLYISYITDPVTFEGAILKFDGKTGAPLGRFDQGRRMLRPYGLAFGPDNHLYVSSFRTDEILRYDAAGNFVNVFAMGTGSQDGLNGPNDLLFGKDGTLYVTTQGSVADGTGAIQYLFPSQLLTYNINDPAATPSLFAEPEVQTSPFGFVSLLGLTFGPTGDLFVSDFANAIRRYDPTTKQLLDEFSATSFGFMGNLAFDPSGNLYSPTFDFADSEDPNIGTVARFDGETGKPLPAPGQTGSTFIPETKRLQRTIGVAYVPVTVPEPGVVLGLLGVGVLGMRWLKRSSQ